MTNGRKMANVMRGIDNMNTANQDQHEELPLSDFIFPSETLRKIVQYLREHHPKFKGLSLERTAYNMGISFSTLKGLKRGLITDPRCGTLRMISKSTGISMDVLTGLEPWDPEARDPSSSMYKAQVAALEAKVGMLENENNRLRDEVRTLSSELSEAKEHCREQAAEITHWKDRHGEKSGIVDKMHRDLRNHRIFLCAFIFLALTITAGWVIL